MICFMYVPPCMFHVIVPTSFFEMVRHVCFCPGVKENIMAVGNLEELIVKFVLSGSISSRC